MAFKGWPQGLSRLMPLALLWLAAHAVFLAALLSLKFLTAKVVALLLLAGGAIWFLANRCRRAVLLPPAEMV
jgi:hypothetical protein